MIQFFEPDITNTHCLGPEESGHCIRVLRRKPGDRIYVTDGKGKRFECEIIKADSRKVGLQILSETEIDKSWNFRLTVAVAPTKNADRMAWLVEKCTEIGVDRIIFMDCRHSERHNVNIERLRRNGVSAMNQSLKTRMPEIIGMTPIREVLNLEGDKYFGYCDSQTERKDFSRTLFTRPKAESIIIAIGPEGDFSAEEVKEMRGAGFEAVTFGDERLRTETAALYGATAAHIVYTLKENN